MKEQIKPCPFCGGEAEIDRMYSVNETECLEYLVRCSKCGVSMLENSEEAALSSWNTRKLPENNPLTLDEVKELKSGEVVWIKQEVYLTSQKEIQPVEFYTAMKKQWLFLMIGDFEGHGKLYDELNKEYFVYHNKPEIADVSKKE